MKELIHYNFKKLTLPFFCIMGYIYPISLNAQQNEDSTLLYTDSAVVSNEDHNVDAKKTIKSSDIPVFRSVPDTTVARMRREKDFAYANDPAYWVKEKKVYRKGFWDYIFDFFSSGPARAIFYFLIAALILFVLYRVIVVNELLIFYSAKKPKKLFDSTENIELDPGMIDQRIEESVNQKDYQSAIRYLYLKTLYSLNDKNWIQFHAQATNNEYLHQMSQHKKLKDFRFLTQVYEYVWYGKFEISEQQFSLVYDNFKNFQTAI